ncbi:MAG: GTP cyclohydrolase II RibA [Bosea sp.]|jgi:GTP cyclohydrolase II|nr:GTP cyclohydrolase II RibA [Bosea sp. (in: a-proteobacteria)]
MSVAKRSILGLDRGQDLLAVDRAISELRAARPLLLTGGEGAAVIVSAELLDQDFADRFNTFAAGQARLALPAARLRRLGSTQRKVAGTVALPTIDLGRIEQLVLKVDGRLDAPIAPATAIDLGALELAALSLILPALVVVPVDLAAVAEEPLVRVAVSAVNSFRKTQVEQLTIVGRAPVPLEDAPRTEFVVFRGGEGLRDQVAIVVGELDMGQPVHVRLHSACLTGDLFGSLKCDCGDQLRETVRWMAENQGGILLYLDQEGRGNGISNKMRAYRLQSEGWDTYDADEVLGFDLDQRRFDFAAEMLKQLGVTRVVAMTNNPIKIGAIKHAGLEVQASRRVLGRPNKHNVQYLESKRDRAGHYIDMDVLMARAAPND